MRRPITITIILISITCYSFHSYGGEVVRVAIANNFSKYATQCADPLGQHFKNSVNLAIKDFHKDNPGLPYEIELDVYDYGKSDLEILKIMDQIKYSTAIAVIGFPCSDQALLAANIAEKNGIVFVSFEATTDKLWNHNNYVFKTCFKNSYQAKIIAGLAHNNLAKRRIISIVSKDCEYCTDITGSFRRYFEELGGQIIKEYDVLKTDTNYDFLTSSMKELKYDGVFVASHEFVASKIISQLVRDGIHTAFFSGDSMGNVEGMLFKLLKDTDFKLYATSHWFYDYSDAKSADFQKHFYENFGIYPNDNSALAYDGMMYLLNGIKNSQERTREGLRYSLKDIKQYNGLRKITFSNSGTDSSVSLYILSASKGHFKLYNKVNPQ